MSLHLGTLIALAAAAGFLALRVLFKTVKFALLLAAPALLYVLHSH